MTNEILKSHYERKYMNENNHTEISNIALTRMPITRFEAAVKYFPRYFKGGSILELGAGNGNVAKTLLTQDIGINKYVLGDISLPRVQGIMQNLADPRIETLLLNAEDIPAATGQTYDAIIMIALIEHLIDPLGAMRHIGALLNPSGFVYIDTPNIAKYTRRIQLLLGRFPSTASTNEGLKTYEGNPVDLYDEGHLHYFTYRGLSHMLTNYCGFSRAEKISYPCGKLLLGKTLETLAAKVWPEAFSECAIVAFK